MQQRIAQHDAINWLCPVNWSHPLNHGLLAWYLALPNQPGWKSSQWLDLCDPVKGHHGPLTNMAPATAWQPSSRPGGWGQLAFDGSNDKVACGVPIVPATGEFCVSMWVNMPDGQGGGRPWAQYQNVSGNRTLAACSRSSTDLILSLQIGGTTSTTGNVPYDTPQGRWFFVAYQRSGSDAITFWINGVQVGSGTNGTQVDNREFTIGNASTSNFPFAGIIDGVRVHNRALSATEHREFYRLDQQHYPGLLNRVQLPYYAPQAGGGGFIDNTSPILRHIMGAAL